jgi:2,4-dienoyl-CoA reductase (NADPH2)
MPIGRRVVIVGGGLVGLELAEFLVERGREVTVLEESEKFGAELSVVRRWRVLHGLRSHGTVLINRCRLLGIEPRSLQITTTEGDAEIEADTVILATGARPDAGLAAGLEARGIEVHRAGDCAEVGYIQGAMHSGHRIGRAL